MARDLLRTRGGLMVHHADCRHATSASAVPWLWADRQTLTDLKYVVLMLGYRTCRECKPLDAASADETGGESNE